MKRVVVTGLGIVSSIGNNRTEVVDSLKQGRSGITFARVYQDLGFRSHVHGPVNIELDAFIDRKIKRFMGDGAAFNYIAMQQAIDDSGLDEADISNVRTGLVMGSGGLQHPILLRRLIFYVKKGIKKSDLYGAKNHVQHQYCLLGDTL